MDKLISVVIPTYNCGKYLIRTIESIFNQTYRNFEIIVVDDGSTDNTEKILEKYNGNRQFRYIYQENRGISAARNAGIRASSGEFIAFLDADDMWLPEKLERQISLIIEFPDVGLVGCGYYGIDESGKRIKEIRSSNYLNKELLLNDLMVRNVVTSSGSGALVRKECFDKVGLFDESFRSTEDRDMWFRILKNYDSKYVNESLVTIMARKGSLSKNVSNMKIYQKKFIQKHFRNMRFITKIKSYSYVYLDAANEYYQSHRLLLAAINAFFSIIIYPLKVYPNDDKYQILIKSLLPKMLLSTLKNMRTRIYTNKDE